MDISSCGCAGQFYSAARSALVHYLGFDLVPFNLVLKATRVDRVVVCSALSADVYGVKQGMLNAAQAGSRLHHQRPYYFGRVPAAAGPQHCQQISSSGPLIVRLTSAAAEHLSEAASAHAAGLYSAVTQAGSGVSSRLQASRAASARRNTWMHMRRQCLNPSSLNPKVPRPSAAFHIKLHRELGACLWQSDSVRCM
jgi:hypothetical protein